VGQSLCTPTQLSGSLRAQPAQLPPGISQSLRSTGIAPVALLNTDQANPRGATALFGRPHGEFERIGTGVVMKKQLVSVVEDDRFFRESMRRLMRSLGPGRRV
jgi:hypothetical protein